MARLVLVSGWPGAGTSTIAAAIAPRIGATVVSFDWVMSGLRSFPEVWGAVELPVERQREIGWTLMARVAEQQLTHGRSVVLDLVARGPARDRFADLVAQTGSRFDVIECTCSDIAVHRSRVDGRIRGIPGWYELAWEHVERSRTRSRTSCVFPDPGTPLTRTRCSIMIGRAWAGSRDAVNRSLLDRLPPRACIEKRTAAQQRCAA